MAAPPLGRSAQWLMRCAFALQVVSPAPASCSGKENIPPTTTSKPEPTQTQRQKAAIDYERRRLKVSELPGLPFSLKRTMVKSDARRLREAVEEDREAKRARMSTLGLRGGSAPVRQPRRRVRQLRQLYFPDFRNHPGCYNHTSPLILLPWRHRPSVAVEVA